MLLRLRLLQLPASWACHPRDSQHPKLLSQPLIHKVPDDEMWESGARPKASSPPPYLSKGSLSGDETQQWDEGIWPFPCEKEPGRREVAPPSGLESLVL